MNNPLETLAGGNLPPTPQESARRILEKLAVERLGRIIIKGVSDEQIKK